MWHITCPTTWLLVYGAGSCRTVIFWPPQFQNCDNIRSCVIHVTHHMAIVNIAESCKTVIFWPSQFQTCDNIWSCVIHVTHHMVILSGARSCKTVIFRHPQFWDCVYKIANLWYCCPHRFKSVIISDTCYSCDTSHGYTLWCRKL